ncbi:hypothetical protein [Flammeovirga sp. SubArs3]|uniref:hypothetical protein n=1 Tax=Flammeovirga sp. SubArs3 TaxID=2995316 RepID=UPI00248CED93|nr:hypothetical protein [Flammeovirga sp. SubArs3]
MKEPFIHTSIKLEDENLLKRYFDVKVSSASPSALKGKALRISWNEPLKMIFLFERSEFKII